MVSLQQGALQIFCGALGTLGFACSSLSGPSICCW